VCVCVCVCVCALTGTHSSLWGEDWKSSSSPILAILAVCVYVCVGKE